MVLIRFEIGGDQAFHYGLRRVRPALAFLSYKHEFLHSSRFQIAQRGAGNFSQIVGRKLRPLSCSNQKQPLRAETRGKMYENNFMGLSGQFPALHQ